VRLEYAAISLNYAATEVGGAWTWDGTMTLAFAGRIVAKWTHQEPIGKAPGEVGDETFWSPDPRNLTEWAKPTSKVLDDLGALGWELVTYTEGQRVLWQDPTSKRWPNTVSFATQFDYMFKRIADA
jgi:hypothetical protein